MGCAISLVNNKIKLVYHAHQILGTKPPKAAGDYYDHEGPSP